MWAGERRRKHGSVPNRNQCVVQAADAAHCACGGMTTTLGTKGQRAGTRTRFPSLLHSILRNHSRRGLGWTKIAPLIRTDGISPARTSSYTCPKLMCRTRDRWTGVHSLRFLRACLRQRTRVFSSRTGRITGSSLLGMYWGRTSAAQCAVISGTHSRVHCSVLVFYYVLLALVVLCIPRSEDKALL
jgi:hypothetical protein